jgi:uncharacterized protein YqeY
MRETITAALKAATKAQDKRRTSTLRLVSAAIKDRDIAARTAGKGEATLPKQLSDKEMQDAISAAIAKTSAASVKDIFGFYARHSAHAHQNRAGVAQLR